MTAQERRNAILSHLQRGKSPLSATALAGLLGVSRQVIVGDVALLRAGGVLLGKTVFRQSFPAGFKAPGRLPVRVI